MLLDIINRLEVYMPKIEPSQQFLWNDPQIKSLEAKLQPLTAPAKEGVALPRNEKPGETGTLGGYVVRRAFRQVAAGFEKLIHGIKEKKWLTRQEYAHLKVERRIEKIKQDYKQLNTIINSQGTKDDKDAKTEFNKVNQQIIEELGILDQIYGHIERKLTEPKKENKADKAVTETKKQNESERKKEKFLENVKTARATIKIFRDEVEKKSSKKPLEEEKPHEEGKILETPSKTHDIQIPQNTQNQFM